MSGNKVMVCPLCLSAGPQKYHTARDAKTGDRDYWRCGECDLIFLDPVRHLGKSEEKRRYDMHENDPADARYRRFLDQLAFPLAQRLPEGARGLDYGSGPGPAMRVILKERGFDAVNYDPYYAADQSVLSDTYDFVTCTEVVEHFYDPRAEFELFSGLLNSSGGFLGIMTLIFSETIDFSKWHYPTDPTHVCFYSPKTFQWIGLWQNWRIELMTHNTVIYYKD